MRADAARNRLRVLEAADEVFGEEGIDASTELVARRAGVGVGTVFRHFPTKESLLRELLLLRLTAIAEEVERRADDSDPGRALSEVLRWMVEQAPRKQLYLDGAGRIDETAVAARARTALGVLLGRAQAAGSVRKDVRVEDLTALVLGAAHATAQLGGDPTLREGFLRVVLDGLRPPAAGTQPGTATSAPTAS